MSDGSGGPAGAAGTRVRCPHCGRGIPRLSGPLLTADIIIEVAGTGTAPAIVLVRRANPPPGWAIPGGFVDYGERVEDAARREAREETGLDVTLTSLLGVYSDPGRDPRFHTSSVVYVATASGMPEGGDDAAEARLFTRETLPADIAFDHRAVLEDYFRWRDSSALA